MHKRTLHRRRWTARSFSERSVLRISPRFAASILPCGAGRTKAPEISHQKNRVKGQRHKGKLICDSYSASSGTLAEDWFTDAGEMTG